MRRLVLALLFVTFTFGIADAQQPTQLEASFCLPASCDATDSFYNGVLDMAIIGFCYNGEEPQGAVSPTATNCAFKWDVHVWADSDEEEVYDDVTCTYILVGEVTAYTHATTVLLPGVEYNDYDGEDCLGAGFGNATPGAFISPC